MSRSPLFNGENLIGEVVDEELTIDENDQVLYIRLNKQVGLVRELMAEGLVYFDIVPAPQQGN